MTFKQIAQFMKQVLTFLVHYCTSITASHTSLTDFYSPGNDCWVCSGISKPHWDHFVAAEVLRCCWQEEGVEEHQGVVAPGEAGSGSKAHCCCCCCFCCWLQKRLLVTTELLPDDLCLPWLE